jgi:hypothetical protein
MPFNMLVVFTIMCASGLIWPYIAVDGQQNHSSGQTQKSTDGHIILIGASTLDNSAYVRSDKNVLSHLQTLLPEKWQVILLARDGTLLREIDLAGRR